MRRSRLRKNTGCLRPLRAGREIWHMGIRKGCVMRLVEFNRAFGLKTPLRLIRYKE